MERAKELLGAALQVAGGPSLDEARALRSRDLQGRAERREPLFSPAEPVQRQPAQAMQLGRLKAPTATRRLGDRLVEEVNRACGVAEPQEYLRLQRPVERRQDPLT